MGTLYIVDVPLDSPGDATLRALRVLREVTLIVAPDLSRARRFLARCEIDTPVVGFGGNENQAERVLEVTASALEALAAGDVALLSDAVTQSTVGYGHHLVQAAAERNLAVVSVPGPSAAVTAVVFSGLPADAFVCLGALPQHAPERRRLLTSLITKSQTVVAFEVAELVQDALRDAAEVLGDRPLALIRTSGGCDENVWRGTLHEAVARFDNGLPCGDWALVIGGAAETRRRWPEEMVRAELGKLLTQGASRKAAARRVAEISGWRSREVYRLAQETGFTFDVS